MVDTLVGKTCTPCKGGTPPITPQEAEGLHAQIPQWDVRDEALRIERTSEGHHPDISFGWGYVTVTLQTKKIKGLHENDFIVAAKIDRLFDRANT